MDMYLKRVRLADKHNNVSSTTTGSARGPRWINGQKPAACRCLFGLPDSSDRLETDQIFQDFESRELEKFTDKYNFHFSTETPLDGRFEWEKVEGQRASLRPCAGNTPEPVSSSDAVTSLPGNDRTEQHPVETTLTSSRDTMPTVTSSRDTTPTVIPGKKRARSLTDIYPICKKSRTAKKKNYRPDENNEN